MDLCLTFPSGTFSTTIRLNSLLSEEILIEGNRLIIQEEIHPITIESEESEDLLTTGDKQITLA